MCGLKVVKKIIFEFSRTSIPREVRGLKHSIEKKKEYWEVAPHTRCMDCKIAMTAEEIKENMMV
jgi:hypothetical protein